MSEKEKRIGIVGERDLVLAFQSAGLKGFSVSSPEEAKEALKKVKKEEDFGILFVSAAWMPYLKEEVESILDYPVVVEIPDIKGSPSTQEEFISKIVERAVGVDLSKKKGE